jgi:O-antigen/teichoic acid export membrane protein
MENIGTRVIYSGFWSLGSNWLSKGLGVAKMIILARLLSPLDFGILGLTTFSLNILNVFSETGIEPALIQKDKIGREELDTTWTLSIIRGAVLFVLLFLGGGWIASYFDNDSLTPVLKIMAVTLLLGGCTNIGIIFFQKELAFKKKAILELAADIGGTVSAIVIAFWLRNVWALVAGTIIWGIVKCLFSYRLHDYRPRLYWNWHIVKPFLSFGKYVFWIGVMAFIITNADNALVGKLLGLTMLGFYAMAFNISNMPVTSLTGIMSQVFFPAYAKIKNDPGRIDEAFRKTFEAATIILMPLTTMMIILAPGFTALFLGKKWLPMVPALQVLCIFGLFRGISSLFYPLHLALNRPDIQAKIKSFDLVTFIILVYPLTIKWGILGTSCAMAIIYMINMIMNIAFTFRLIPLRWNRLGASMIVPLFMSFVIIVTAILIQLLKLPFGEMTKFILVMLLCLGIGVLFAVIYRRKLITDIINAMKISS